MQGDCLRVQGKDLTSNQTTAQRKHDVTKALAFIRSFLGTRLVSTPLWRQSHCFGDIQHFAFVGPHALRHSFSLKFASIANQVSGAETLTQALTRSIL